MDLTTRPEKIDSRAFWGGALPVNKDYLGRQKRFKGLEVRQRKPLYQLLR